ncbi:hypothetical protein L0F51_00225 [Afifella sp. H1R]|uniref:DnaT-like ssDNA-binding protein n=1 Tax=Afifella sp. H1R TaxID=2908841 RepID=UPI001F434B84|nr:DnaT-like ssDNA-binding protein [Afifella sp. H1R]MCF1502190.1 hypothetical protein [Afifella sp. H1R]
MTLVVEDGTGIIGAESYASVAEVSAYWGKRPHDPLATSWSDGSAANQEGALREATVFLDANYGGRYRGIRASYSQGLEWPRYELDDSGDKVAVKDRDGNELPDLPAQLKSATAELAVRALSERLVIEPSSEGVIGREKVGQVETEYAVAAAGAKSFASVDGILSQIIGASANWYWR